MSYRNAISSSDPEALEKLTEKLNGCEQSQEYMKALNAYFRKNGTCVGFPELSDETAKKFDAKIEKAYSFNKQPFPSYELTNNSASIRRLKNRIAELSANKEVGFVGWKFNGGEAIVNDEICRLQLCFDDKLDEKQRMVLKQNGFKWSPKEGAWQRLLNSNAMYAANRIDFLKPLDGRSVREHQPKAPVRQDNDREER